MLSFLCISEKERRNNFFDKGVLFYGFIDSHSFILFHDVYQSIPLSGSGGGTYCAVASLRLMGFIEENVLSKNTSSSIIDLPLLLSWCLQVYLPHNI